MQLDRWLTNARTGKSPQLNRWTPIAPTTFKFLNKTNDERARFMPCKIMDCIGRFKMLCNIVSEETTIHMRVLLVVVITSTYINLYQLASTCINLHQLASTYINLHQLASICITTAPPTNRPWFRTTGWFNSNLRRRLLIYRLLYIFPHTIYVKYTHTLSHSPQTKLAI